ncbi:MAG: ATP-binding cassette domain-containing protein [Spirochaetes bacterium]|nr:ATP-binding cassette domain-containing protein [Spirochaetota bacterium]
MALINLQNITIAFGGAPLLDHLNIQIHTGEKICILGRNGAGKSTMMKIIDGSMAPDSGSILKEREVKTSLLTQEVPDSIYGTIYDVIAGGTDVTGDVHHNLDSHDERKHRLLAEKIISLLSFNPHLRFENLSAGMKRRVMLGRALTADPDIILLDEPTNHLDLDSITWLEDFLIRYERTVLFVTHDRAFLQNIATRIIELDRGRLFDWKCDYRTFIQRKEAWLESEETQNALFDKRLAREEIWIRKGIKARRTRNEGRVRELKKMREERSMRREVQGNVRMDIHQAEKSGRLVIEADNISFGYDTVDIIRDFSTTIMRGDRVGIIGPNGCGKSTLIRVLTDELPARKGTIKTGVRIQKVYFDQMRTLLDEDRTIKENVTDGNEIMDFNGKTRHIIGYLQNFLFTPDMAVVKVKALSGGEKNRLLLAKLFAKPSNLLIMDEPTNDLDLETVELLEELLLEYEGTVLIVSHDRFFLNNVVTSTIVFEGGGELREYVGGYDDWIRQRKPRPEKKEKKRIPEKKAAPSKKITFNERRELETIPARLDKLETAINEIHSLLAEPSFYQKKGELVAETRLKLKNFEDELEGLYKRWEELDGKNI